MDASDSEPATLLDIELRVGRVDEAELPFGVLAMELSVALHRGASVEASIDDGDPIEDPSVANGARLERFDHEPLVRIDRAYLGPMHAARVATMRWADKFWAADNGGIEASHDPMLRLRRLDTRPARACRAAEGGLGAVRGRQR
jgi:hypothetical protein